MLIHIPKDLERAARADHPFSTVLVDNQLFFDVPRKTPLVAVMQKLSEGGMSITFNGGVSVTGGARC